MEVVLADEQLQQTEGHDRFVIFKKFDGRHLGRSDREFGERDRAIVEDMLTKRRHRDPNRRLDSTEEVLEELRAAAST